MQIWIYKTLYSYNALLYPEVGIMARKFKFAPLRGGFMAVSILGILISLMYLYPMYPDWGVTFAVVFAIMFLASLASMTLADPDDFVELEEKTAPHKPDKKKVKKKG